jgi:hypothetical protein
MSLKNKLAADLIIDFWVNFSLNRKMKQNQTYGSRILFFSLKIN